MARVTRGFKARRRRNKVLKLAKGYRGGRHRLYRSATEAVDRALNYAYRDRRNKKRDFRSLWIARISAAAKAGTGFKYLLSKSRGTFRSRCGCSRCHASLPSSCVIL